MIYNLLRCMSISIQLIFRIYPQLYSHSYCFDNRFLIIRRDKVIRSDIDQLSPFCLRA
nr:hypothetical protein [Delftia sp. PE138]